MTNEAHSFLIARATIELAKASYLPLLSLTESQIVLWWMRRNIILLVQFIALDLTRVDTSIKDL
jgi:hypothetical protein